MRPVKQPPTANEAWLPFSSRTLASGWASQPGAWCGMLRPDTASRMLVSELEDSRDRPLIPSLRLGGLLASSAKGDGSENETMRRTTRSARLLVVTQLLLLGDLFVRHEYALNGLSLQGLLMGHVILKHHETHEVFSDVLLWMLRSFLLIEARAQESQLGNDASIQLMQFYGDWEWPGPGLVTGAEFDEFIRDGEGRLDMLLEHLHRTGNRIAEFGDFIPVAYLDTHVDCGPPRWDRDFPTGLLLKEIGRICNMLCSQHRALN